MFKSYNNLEVGLTTSGLARTSIGIGTVFLKHCIFVWFVFLFITNFVSGVPEICIELELLIFNFYGEQLCPLYLSVLPIGVKFYDDILVQKELIKKENKGKSGVYLFYNKINSNCYVGSGVDLSVRLSNYFSNYYLNRLDT
jgi:hypothetical protein